MSKFYITLSTYITALEYAVYLIEKDQRNGFEKDALILKAIIEYWKSKIK